MLQYSEFKHIELLPLWWVILKELLKKQVYFHENSEFCYCSIFMRSGSGIETLVWTRILITRYIYLSFTCRDQIILKYNFKRRRSVSGKNIWSHLYPFPLCHFCYSFRCESMKENKAHNYDDVHTTFFLLAYQSQHIAISQTNCFIIFIKCCANKSQKTTQCRSKCFSPWMNELF